MQTQTKPQETWIKVLSKGVITIPKEFREQLDIKEGDVAKARIDGDKLIIQSRKASHYKDYRVYTKKQIDEWVKEDQLPEPLASEVEKRWSDLP